MAKQNKTQYYQLTAEDKAAIRREKVRLNVKAYRARQKHKQQTQNAGSQSAATSNAPTGLRWVPERRLEAMSANNYKHSNRDPKTLQNGRESNQMVNGKTNQFSMTELCLMREPDPQTQYTTGLIDLFRTRFLPHGLTMPPSACTMERLATPCASWVTRAFYLAFYKDKAAIRDMLRSIALGLLAMENCREDVRVKSLHAYRTSLTEVRRHVVHVGKSKLDPSDFLALILSCHVAAMYELAVNVSLNNMIRHINGIAALILHQTSGNSSLPENFYDLIEEFRIMDMCFCLAIRRTSMLIGFKNRTVRIGVDGRSPMVTDKSSSHMGALIDIADRICVAMVNLDDLKPFVATDRMARALLQVVEESYDILDDLKIWNEEFIALHGSSICNPGYDSSTEDLQFLSLSVASTWGYSLAYRLYALDTLISAMKTLSRIEVPDRPLTDPQMILDRSSLLQAQSDMLDTARLLLRSLPWFYQEDIGITGRTLSILPLESVRRAFSNDVWHDSTAVSVDPECHDDLMTNCVPELLSRDLAMYEELSHKAKACGLPILSEQLLRSLERSSSQTEPMSDPSLVQTVVSRHNGRSNRTHCLTQLSTPRGPSHKPLQQLIVSV